MNIYRVTFRNGASSTADTVEIHAERISAYESDMVNFLVAGQPVAMVPKAAIVSVVQAKIDVHNVATRAETE